jgi:uncharacterized protein
VSKGRTPARRTHATQDLPFVIKKSAIAGRGAFATRRIRKGQRIIEYIGERITHVEADRRYDDEAMSEHHTFLFAIDDTHVIDGAVNGNDARFINHSCDPNCEAVDEDGHIFVEAITNIQPGTELTYDYQFERGEDDDELDESRYPCRCGTARCRGTILAPRKGTTSAGKGGKKHRKRKKDGQGKKSGKGKKDKKEKRDKKGKKDKKDRKAKPDALGTAKRRR